MKKAGIHHIAFAMTMAADLGAQQWSQVTSPARPPAAHGAAMGYHRSTASTVWFGGQAQLTGWPIPFFQQTWLFDGTSWLQASPSIQPPARSFHGMVGNDWFGQSNVFLFGGVGPDGTPHSDLWRWNGTTWQDLAVSYTCPARCNPAIASYGTGLWLHGGYDPVTGNNLSDTWIFGGGSWSQVAGGPVARRGARATEIDGLTIVMHGGESTGGILSDTWTWNNGSWTSVASANGPTRTEHAMGYDAHSRQVFLAGGKDASGFADSVWRFDGSTWFESTPTSGPMPLQAVTAFAHDPLRHRLAVVGGDSAAGATDEHWEFGSTFPVTRFGTGCAVTGSTPQLQMGAAAVGGTVSYAISSSPSVFGVALAVGFSDQSWNGTPLPMSLAAIGVPCDLLVEPFTIRSWFSSGSGTGGYGSGFPIPSVASLRGMAIFAQAAVFDAAGMRGVSDAARLVIL